MYINRNNNSMKITRKTILITDIEIDQSLNLEIDKNLNQDQGQDRKKMFIVIIEKI